MMFSSRTCSFNALGRTLFSAVCAFGVWIGSAHGSGSNDPPREFTLHWCGTTDDNEVRWRTGIKWSDRLTFGEAPVRRDVVAIYEQWVALDVRTRGLSITTEEGYEATLRETVARAFAERVPDPGFAGYILLDIEFLPLVWGKRTGGPELYWEADHGPRQHDLWYTFIRERRPEVMRDLGTEAAERALAASYNDAVRDWHRMLVRVARELRPQAKISFYGMPLGSRHANYTGQHEAHFKGLNDLCAWYIELQDAQMVPLYQDRYTVPVGQTPRGPWENTIEQGRDFIITNLREAKRIGQGKPILVLAMARYPDFVRGHELRYLSEINHELMFRLPREAGADGIVLWDHVENQPQFDELQRYVNDRIVPDFLTMTGGRPGEGSGSGNGGGGENGNGSGNGNGNGDNGNGGGNQSGPGGDGGSGNGSGGGEPGGSGDGQGNGDGQGSPGDDQGNRTPPDDGGGSATPPDPGESDPPPGGNGSPPGNGGGSGESNDGGSPSPGGGGTHDPPSDPGWYEPPPNPPVLPAVPPRHRFGVQAKKPVIPSQRSNAASLRIARPGDPRNTVQGSRPQGLRVVSRQPALIRVLPTSKRNRTQN